MYRRLMRVAVAALPSIFLLFPFAAVVLVDFRGPSCVERLLGFVVEYLNGRLDSVPREEYLRCHFVYCVMSKALYVKLVTSFLCA
jgi:hypothetical protein